ncbi:MAG: tyrosine-type recombinase/integrase [Planctomycetes bacterium]|nr:tyrosine-type recombinase/integrase [Planctomycetota bacterium]
MSRRRTPALTWEAALDAYETHLRARRASPRTISRYLADLRHLAASLPDRTPGEVTTEDLRTLQVRLLTGEASVSRRPLSAASASRIGSAWRGFFGFLAAEGRVALDPTVRLEQPRAPRRAPGDALTVKEVERLLGAFAATTPASLRDRAILEVLYATGLRNAELCALDLADVDHAEREVTVRAGKGEKGRIVPITRSAHARLRDYLDDARAALASSHPDSGGALFLTARGRRVHGVHLLRLLREAARRAGMKKNVTPHTLRRTFATALLRNGVNVRVIQVLLGHESLTTTAAYLKLDRSDLRRELLLRHPRERLEA